MSPCLCLLIHPFLDTKCTVIKSFMSAIPDSFVVAFLTALLVNETGCFFSTPLILYFKIVARSSYLLVRVFFDLLNLPSEKSIQSYFTSLHESLHLNLKVFQIIRFAISRVVPRCCYRLSFCGNPCLPFRPPCRETP